MELQYGGGAFDILLDVASGQLFAYPDEQLHARFGGRQYYTSCSGASGAGHISEVLGLVKVAGYRVDTATGPWASIPTGDTPGIAGWRFAVPFNYRGGASLPLQEWPIVATAPDGRAPVFLTDGELFHALRGQLELEERAIVIRFVKRPGAELEEATLKFYVGNSEMRWSKQRRLLEALNKETLQFEWPANDGSRPATNPFWARLGLHPLPDGRVYKVAFGICRASYSREELATVAGLQAAAPRNVRVLAPNVYVQGRFGSGSYDAFAAVGLFVHDGVGEVEFEISIDETRAVRAIGGDYGDILTELEAGAAAKAAEIRRQAEERARWEAEREAAYVASLEANHDRAVTWEEAERACSWCSLPIAEIFDGQQEVPVLKLADHVRGREILERVFSARAEIARQAIRQMASADREAWFRRACEQNGEVIVTFADSRAAGNCEPGTRDFRDREFPGREQVTVRELARCAGRPEVRRVLEYKLRQLGVAGM